MVGPAFAIFLLLFSCFVQLASAETCVAGRYCSSEDWWGVNQCSDCPAGFYCLGQDDEWGLNCWGSSNERNSDNNAPKEPCPKGRFSNEPSQPSCTICSSGKYQSSTGGTLCTGVCSAGKFLSDEGYKETNHDEETDCKSCGTGKYQSDEGSAACTLCPPNTHSTSVGAVKPDVCLACDGETASIAGSTECYDKPLPLYVNGMCDEQSSYNGNYEVIEVTALGRYYFKKQGEQRYIYWDPSCDGPYAGLNMWIFDIEKPSTTAERDLDAGKYLISSTVSVEEEACSPCADGLMSWPGSTFCVPRTHTWDFRDCVSSEEVGDSSEDR
ncbi:hypothetical protein TrLO_g3234 [Triparma laevis f. longispina]|uniref:Tyrosine-protein kinase ephrin type A/B receptor-like domain-containing protein n=1 Tax=Triparma laevis f. longispina TaxID=1714387 RepID=A0A9W7DZB1_9STRA|nr:hypothetical protein TrLO_g3234 [Triparma laevis f. longispina]